MKLYIVISTLFLVKNSICYTKVWMYNADITDQHNWETGTTQKKCEGLIFAEKNTANIVIEQLKIKRLVLPRSATLEFPSGSKIEFDENSREDLNCVKLKPLKVYSWLHFEGWNNTDDPNNPAIPYNERPPSRFDDVVVRSGVHTNVVLTSRWTTAGESIPLPGPEVKSLMVDNFKFRSNLQLAMSLSGYTAESTSRRIRITNKVCKDVTGCATGLTGLLNDVACETVFGQGRADNLAVESVDCQDPIRPIGFCNQPKCGGFINIKSLRPGFRLDKINTKLKEYSSYTHASKISDSTSEIQVIFMDKNSPGQGVDEANEFYNILKNDKSYFCGVVILQTSGIPLQARYEHMQISVSIIFGTLLAAIVMFGLVFLVYSPAFASLNLRNRLLGSRPLSTYILRYDNIEDRGYIVDGQSIAGSVLNLNTAFDNPMYDHASSSRSTSNETIASVKLDGHQDGLKEKSIKENDADLIEAEAEELSKMTLRKEVQDVKEDLLLKDL